jgi:hypothetical protein
MLAGVISASPFKRSPHTGNEVGQMKAVGFLCAPSRILAILAVVTLNSTGLASAQTTPGAETFVSIGSGEMTAVYFPVAKAICHAIFNELRDQGFRCSAETTPGSAYNVGRVVSGELEFGSESNLPWSHLLTKSGFLVFNQLRLVPLRKRLPSSFRLTDDGPAAFGSASQSCWAMTGVSPVAMCGAISAKTSGASDGTGVPATVVGFPIIVFVTSESPYHA